MFLFTLYSHIHFQRTAIKHITALCRRCHNVMSETQLPYLIILFTHFQPHKSLHVNQTQTVIMMKQLVLPYLFKDRPTNYHYYVLENDVIIEY